MIEIRAERPEDIKSIHQVNVEAFGKENEAKLVDGIRNSSFFIPELSLVAIKENQVIGHILLSEISIVKDEQEWSTIGLAPMAVSPSYQNNGIGSLLVNEAIKRCKNLGYKHIAVLGHPNFYPKFGFQTSRLFGIESPFPVPDEVFMVMELEEGTLKDIDGKVKYPEAFQNV